MKKINLTQRVASHPISRKAVHITKTAAEKIKEDPKKAAKYGFRLKLCETLITGIAFGAVSTLINNYKPIDNPPQTIYQKSPIIKDDSQEFLWNYIENKLKFT